MSVLTDLVDEVATVKSDIKVAIINKGVSVTNDVPFTEYASKIDDIVSSSNPQAKITYKAGLNTYDSGEKTFYSYDTTYVPNYEYHPATETIWISSTAVEDEDLAYDSKIENDQIVPDFSKPISVILDIVAGYNSIYLKIYGQSGAYIPRKNETYSITYTYDSLNSVTVDYATMKALGIGVGSSIHITTPKTAEYAFVNDQSLQTIVCDSVTIGEGAFTQLWNLQSITLTNYKGATSYTQENGYMSWNNEYSTIIGTQSLNTLNAPELLVASNNFASNTYNSSNDTLVFNAPKLEGVLGSSFIGSYWSGNAKDRPYNILKYNNIDFRLFKYMSNSLGDLLYDYISDVDNNITDTLTFPNLEYIGNNVFDFNYNYNNFNNITTLNLPKLKCISHYTHLNFNNVISIDLPKIEYIGNEIFSGNMAMFVKTINIGDTCKNIEKNAFFNGVDSAVININLPAPSAGDKSWKADAPWGAKNSTVNWTGTATQTTLHKYDRVDNKATVVDFFTDSNDQRYALCVVDAAYRSTKGYSYSVNSYTPSSLVGLTDYNAALSDTNSGSWYMNIFDEEEAGGYPMANFPAFKFAKNACLVTVDGNTYTGVVPTVNELLAIREDKVTLDTYDPTLSDYASNSLSNWSFGSSKGYVRTCMLTGDKSGSIVLSMDSYQDQYSITSDATGVCPVIEIPVDANGTVISN